MNPFGECKMIGRGIFRNLVSDLTRSDVPGGAVRFDRALFSREKCRICWNPLRRVFCVYRPRGPMTKPEWYMDLMQEDLPLNDRLLTMVIRAVRFQDSRDEVDPEKGLEMARKLDAEEQRQQQADFIDERLPDFMSDLKRFQEILSDGRRSRTKNVLVT